MPIFENPLLIEVPVTAGGMKFVFTVSENIMAEGGECMAFSHNHGDYELRLFAGGKCVQITENGEYGVSEGDMILLRPNEYHAQPEKAISPDLIQYSIYFKTDCAFDFFCRAKDTDGTFYNLFRAVSREISVKSNGFFCALQGYCTVMATEILRCCRKDVFGSEKTGRCVLWRTKLDRFFFSRYGEDVRISSLAAEINLSVRQTERLIKKTFGMSYSEKLCDTRIRRAKELLKTTDKPIKDIAVNCGFGSNGYFSRCFNLHTGMTPTQYRFQ